MSVEIIVDKEKVINSVEETKEFMNYIEQGYSYKMENECITIEDPDGEMVTSYEYIDLDAIQEEYPDATIYMEYLIKKLK